ncbi:hypothetical protein EVAR_42462_1 [Eumeta japonica]|uniref:Uncharacterized protein n=1 Tax=Eumeta variegata TaxID=151549 RepID=A0A4C1XZ56_EUMVA|nr:hypothetical protein EVAR_42462_1 [Eumeta japonica]
MQHSNIVTLKVGDDYTPYLNRLYEPRRRRALAARGAGVRRVIKVGSPVALSGRNCGAPISFGFIHSKLNRWAREPSEIYTFLPQDGGRGGWRRDLSAARGVPYRRFNRENLKMPCSLKGFKVEIESAIDFRPNRTSNKATIRDKKKSDQLRTEKNNKINKY